MIRIAQQSLFVNFDMYRLFRNTESNFYEMFFIRCMDVSFPLYVYQSLIAHKCWIRIVLSLTLNSAMYLMKCTNLVLSYETYFLIEFF